VPSARWGAQPPRLRSPDSRRVECIDERSASIPNRDYSGHRDAGSGARAAQTAHAHRVDLLTRVDILRRSLGTGSIRGRAGIPNAPIAAVFWRARRTLSQFDHLIGERRRKDTSSPAGPCVLPHPTAPGRSLVHAGSRNEPESRESEGRPGPAARGESERVEPGVVRFGREGGVALRS